MNYANGNQEHNDKNAAYRAEHIVAIAAKTRDIKRSTKKKSKQEGALCVCASVACLIH